MITDKDRIVHEFKTHIKDHKDRVSQLEVMIRKEKDAVIKYERLMRAIEDEFNKPIEELFPQR